MNKGEIYYVNLGTPKGAEQAGARPVLIFQNNNITTYSRTVIIIPFTTNLNRAKLPGGVLVKQGEGGLLFDSVALCHQIRVVDKSRIERKLGTLPEDTVNKIEEAIKLILDLS